MPAVTFSATILKDDHKGGWTYLRWPEPVAFLRTRKPVKVTGTFDGHAFQATFLPWGDGTHILPIKAATLKAICKQAGDVVEVCLDEKS